MTEADKPIVPAMTADAGPLEAMASTDQPADQTKALLPVTRHPTLIRGNCPTCGHRISHSLPGDVGILVELIAGLRRQAHSESDASRMMAEAKSKRQADNPTGECVYMWTKPEETLSWKAAEVLAALTPSPCPGDGMREALEKIDKWCCPVLCSNCADNRETARAALAALTPSALSGGEVE